MTKEERSRLEVLDRALRSETVREHIHSVVVRVREQLARRKDALMSWEPFPFEVLATTIPPEIRSAWVFVLRGDADTGAERHPNSHQRMMSRQRRDLVSLRDVTPMDPHELTRVR
jgi:hypothetical protein